LANILMLLLWARLARILRPPAQRVSRWAIIACAALLFAVIGSNQTSLALILFILAATLAWRSIQRRRIDRLFALLLLLAAVAAAIVLLAPGNHARMEHVSHNINPMGTAKESAMTLVRLVVAQAANPLWLLFTICAVPFFAAKAQSGSTLRPVINPHMIAGFWICSMLATIAPIAHLFPGWAPGRILNITCLLFLTGWFLVLNETVRFLVLKRSFRFRPLPVYVLSILAVLALFGLTGKNNIRTAWECLLSGEANRYDTELRQRYGRIRGCRQADCVVAPLSAFPDLLYYKDISADPEAWPNKPYAEYFGKRSIMLSGQAGRK
jgi:hypothetical protein